ncbi:drug/metabolite transporter (DMT)-like permease [Litoreibacter meonggei]|uniref:Drug/metabolite transporter (DMT)-like permease n=1 Tax=Litoreibacter meonggei TaxID=1049199 RepID=A0A497VXP8_9RHOB|nr:DMT family transporter [Litoreibacter meonggei]RLJ41653.1 drug/metabolite transporter (DMT)-like permease [Litoreibacter meonggei]
MNAQKTMSTQAWLEMGLLAVIWGGSFLSIRLALNEVPVMTAVAHRVFWAMLVLWGYILVRKFPLPTSPKIWVAFLVMGLLNNVIPFSLMAWGQLHIETGLTSILNATTAIFGVVVASIVFSDERLTKSRAIGVVLGFLGVATAIGLENLMQFNIRSTAQLAVLAGTLSYAFAGAWARKMLVGLSPQVAAAGMLTGSTAVMVPLAFAIDGPPSFQLSVTAWGAIAYYAVVATACAYLLYYRILAMAGSGNLMICTLLVAPVAIILGALVLGEELAPRAYAGFGLLALGLLVLDGRIFAKFRKAP